MQNIRQNFRKAREYAWVDIRLFEIVDAPGPFIGTVHLDALPWKNVQLSDYYPWNTPRRD